MDPRKKLSAFLTIMPVAQTPAAAAQPQPQPQPSGTTDDPTTPEDETETGAGASDEALGGCSTSGGSAGFLSLLLIGLAAFIRRRR
jgi:MYXO-CTERM domain-containing protein